MTKHPNPKTAVKLIREAFQTRGAEIQTKAAYNLLAQLWGYKDWPTANAALKADKKQPPVFNHVDGTLNDWPVWVFCNQGGSEDEPMFVYPYGVRLENLYANRHHWHLIDDRDTIAVEVPDDLLTPAEQKKLHELFVGQTVASAYPDSEEYGFPACANHREAHLFLSEELGWGYISTEKGMSLVDVEGRCRGDDGATEWWVEARVHPSVHARLLAATTPEIVAEAKRVAGLN